MARDNYLPHLFRLRDNRQVFACGIRGPAILSGALLVPDRLRHRSCTIASTWSSSPRCVTGSTSSPPASRCRSTCPAASMPAAAGGIGTSPAGMVLGDGHER
jgi:hypothetical protein